MRHRSAGHTVVTELRELVADLAVAAVQSDQGASDLGLAGGEFGDLPSACPYPHLGVDHDLAQFRDETGRVLVGEETGVYAEDVGDLEQYGHGKRPGVVLELVEVARGDLELASELGLGQPALLAQLPQTSADQRARHAGMIARTCEYALRKLGTLVGRLR